MIITAISYCISITLGVLLLRSYSKIGLLKERLSNLDTIIKDKQFEISNIKKLYYAYENIDNNDRSHSVSDSVNRMSKDN